MLTYTVQGRIALPIRAIPLHCPRLFSPAEVMNMLVDVESYGEAPGLHPFKVNKFDQIQRLHPLELSYDRDAVVSAASTSNLDSMLDAMPADVMVWLDDAKAMYDHMDKEIFLAEARSARPEVMRVWLDQPTISDNLLQKVLAGGAHMSRPDIRQSTIFKNRQRDTKGSNVEVQEIADRLAKDYHAKKQLWPKKKELISGIKAQLHRRHGASNETIEREFKVTWSKRKF